MRKLILILVLAVCSAFAVQTKPNVIIFFTDDQGTLDLNCYGAKDLQTPNLDSIAASGIRFTQAYAHTVCAPSRVALMTGKHPQRLGVNTWLQSTPDDTGGKKKNLDVNEITLARAFKSAGYDTALFGKWHLGAARGHQPNDLGFDRFFGHLGGYIDNYRHIAVGKGVHDLYEDGKEVDRTGEYFPELMVGKALEYLDQRGDNSFFMTMAFNLPHYPEQPSGKFADAYPDMPMPRQSYARVVSTVDDYIGQVLRKLDEKGLREDTVLVMMADNGHSQENKVIKEDGHVSGFPKGHNYGANKGGGYTGKWVGHKWRFTEGGVRVPALISYPKMLPQGEVRDQVVTVMDWYPTLLELAGIPRPDTILDGHSMMPIINDPQRASDNKVVNLAWGASWVVREGDWKLIYARDKKINQYRHFLYNLTDTEPEVKDYFDTTPEVVARLMKQHESWKKEINWAGSEKGNAGRKKKK